MAHKYRCTACNGTGQICADCNAPGIAYQKSCPHCHSRRKRIPCAGIVKDRYVFGIGRGTQTLPHFDTFWLCSMCGARDWNPAEPTDGPVGWVFYAPPEPARDDEGMHLYCADCFAPIRAALAVAMDQLNETRKALYGGSEPPPEP